MSQLVYNNPIAKGNGGVMINPNQASIGTATYRNTVRINPDTSVSNLSIGTQKRVLWTLSTAPILADRVYIELVVNNTDGVNALNYADLTSIIFSAYLWDSSAQRAVAIQTTYLEALWMTQFDVDYNEHLRQTKNGTSDVSGHALNYGTVTIAAGATKTFYLEIPTCFLTMGRSKPLMSDLAGMKLEVNFDGAGGLTGPAAASAFSIVSCDVLIYGQQVIPEAINAFKADPKKTYQYNYFELINDLSTPVSTTAGTNYQQRIYSMLNPGIAGLLIAFRPAAMAGTANPTNFLAQDYVDLYKNGTRILSDSDLFQNIYDLINGRDNVSFLMTRFQNIYWMPFCEGFNTAEFRNGILDGHIPANVPDGQISVFWKSGQTAANTQVDVFELRLRSLCVSNNSFWFKDVFSSN